MLNLLNAYYYTMMILVAPQTQLSSQSQTSNCNLNVGFTAMMWKVESLDKAALLANIRIEQNDVRHVVREGDDADTRRVSVDAETERQSARKVHDQLILGLNAARQVENQYHVQHRRTVCRSAYTHNSIASVLVLYLTTKYPRTIIYHKSFAILTCEKCEKTNMTYTVSGKKRGQSILVITLTILDTVS